MTSGEVNRYLARLGCALSGDRAADLSRLQEAHLMAIPYENLDMAAGRGVRFETGALFEKMVVRCRGGVCYELNFLFGDLLRALGYRVTNLSARVPRGRNDPLEHALLLVTLPDGPRICDVGFQTGYRRPLRLEPGRRQSDGMREYRLREENGDFLVERLEKEEYVTEYAFTLTPRRREEHRACCDWFCTSPDSRYTREILCFRETPAGRIRLRNREFTRTERDQTTAELLRSDAQVRFCLREEFGIDLGEDWNDRTF